MSVLSENLNCWTVYYFLNGVGNAFHSVRVATKQDLSPKDVNIFPREKWSVDRQIVSYFHCCTWVTDQAKVKKQLKYV